MSKRRQQRELIVSIVTLSFRLGLIIERESFEGRIGSAVRYGASARNDSAT